MKRLRVLLVIIVVLVAAYFIVAGAAEARARKATAAVKAAGHPTTLADIEPGFRAGSESTARVVEWAAGLLTREDAATLSRRDSVGWPGRDTVKAFLSAQSRVCELLARASVMPPADFGMNPADGYAARITTILPKWPAFRRLLRLQARQLAADGRPDSALAVLATAVRLSHVFAEPVFIYHLVSMVGLDSVCRCAAEIAPRAGVPAIERLAAAVEGLDFKMSESRALEAENVMTCISARTGRTTDASPALSIAVFAVRAVKPAQDYVQARVMETVRAQLENLPRPWFAGWEALARIDSSNRKQDLLGRIVGIYTPNVSLFYARSERATAWRDVTVLGLKALAMKKRTGRLPATLADFAPEAPPDRFSGKPYVYRVLPDGFVVYSIGPDQKDEGGSGPDDRAFRIRL